MLALHSLLLDILVSFILLEPGFTFDCSSDKQKSNVLLSFRLFSLDLLNALRYQGSEDIICMRWQTNCLHVTVVCMCVHCCSVCYVFSIDFQTFVYIFTIRIKCAHCSSNMNCECARVLLIFDLGGIGSI